jgi:hypothetical protein
MQPLCYATSYAKQYLILVISPPDGLSVHGVIRSFYAPVSRNANLTQRSIYCAASPPNLAHTFRDVIVVRFIDNVNALEWVPEIDVHHSMTGFM